MDSFDFIIDKEPAKIFNDVPELDLAAVAKMTPKKLAEEFLKCYAQIGGITWLVK